jgi:hypothetical protein
LSRLKHLAFFEPNVRLKELTEVLDRGWAGEPSISQGAKSTVILANPAGKRSLTDGFERRQEVLFFNQEVRLEMVCERFDDMLPHHLLGHGGVRTAKLSAPLR